MPHTTSIPVIDVTDLRESYGGRNVVDGVSFTVDEAVFFPMTPCAGVWIPVRSMPDVLARSVGFAPFGKVAEALNQAAATSYRWSTSAWSW